ncbi:uncharacterized protein CTRU02_205807 [Colletotrichum truncatum]|uniref:Uncharacterized protein n=1 Tax=Colletotrichum truncatum TaxID=5467 RepID=A0ACC3Z515_COLTU|nr:uncharacterized protein CTRU02_04631 [Colletotrichum truncatum]KAF6795068.1 hypothetical protein CTRU02_04631 [Colletotrichum truncatum]
MPIRLINTETLQMSFFSNSKLQGYAVLSHTWVEDEEVSFQEMCQIADNPDHEATRKSGYHKIVATCQKAKRRGIQYAWVDTCCIDKTSSAELSEAINSMFRWYQDSQICFAYLADLSVSASDTETALKNCRWFARGWCLQELLAPKVVAFYDESWNYRGSKSELKPTIAAITGVDGDVLEDCSVMYSLPVARRMSWASKRITTREEDTAYCLLGIFDVNMPMLYGEGDKAFLRLQEEIIRRYNDTSIFCFSPPRTQPAISNPNEEETILELSKLRFCDMFAKSPADFADCGSMRHKPGSWVPFDRQATSLTNRGIQLGKQTLYWTPRTGIQCFGWEVPYELSQLDGKTPRNTDIFLRKIGRGLFVRVPAQISIPPSEKPKVAEDVCVLLHVNPSIHSQIHEALKKVIRIRIQNHQGTRTEISGQVPRESWDESTSQFLVPDATEFSGYVSIRAVVEGSEDKHVFLGCSTGKGMYPYEPRVAIAQIGTKAPSGAEGYWSSGLWRFTLANSASPTSFEVKLGSVRITANIVRGVDQDSGSEIYTCRVNVYNNVLLKLQREGASNEKGKSWW